MTTDEFNKLPRQDQRMFILKDALHQVQTRQYKTAHTYFMLDVYEPATNGREFLMREEVGKITCSVCAIGACFASAVRLGNEYNVKFIHGYHDTTWLLQKYFHIDELRTLEYLYERRESRLPPDIERFYIVNRVALNQHNDKVWLEFLLNHLIENNGDFTFKLKS